MKVAINTCFGGFSLSEAAFDKLLERLGIEFVKVKDVQYNALGITHYYRKGMVDQDEGYLSPYDFTNNRASEDLIAVIEELGVVNASGKYAELKIVEVPDDVKWHIDEYDGSEHVAEDHRTWS
jgi:hypothetical protein